MSGEQVLKTIEQAERVTSEGVLIAYNIADFLSLELPPRVNILAPVLQTQSLSMIYAMRGIGKTHIALGMAYAIASGGKCLKWHAPEPRACGQLI